MKQILIQMPISRRVRTFAALLPGIFLLGMGLLALFAPKLLAFIAAVFFLYLGTLAMLLGWKILQWRRKALSLFERMEEHVEIVPESDIEISRDVFTSEEIRNEDGTRKAAADVELDSIDYRKIILH